ncbi:MAG: DUF192 domain-containing protein [Gemmatimonadaceae bacterium]|nr:DUF192 domain-containing protein [Gemmatimonadaceae bacterium]
MRCTRRAIDLTFGRESSPLRHVQRLIVSSLLLCVAVLALPGCGERPEPAAAADEHFLDLDSATVRLATDRDTVVLALELAITTDQQRLGLMERRHLPERAGMLFVYDSVQPPETGFWMYRTRIPLDIAFLDSAGVMLSTRAMVPCTATIPQGCPTYPAETPYRYALEVNAGALKRWGAEVGVARLLVRDLPPRRANAARSEPRR